MANGTVSDAKTVKGTNPAMWWRKSPVHVLMRINTGKSNVLDFQGSQITHWVTQRIRDGPLFSWKRGGGGGYEIFSSANLF